MPAPTATTTATMAWSVNKRRAWAAKLFAGIFTAYLFKLGLFNSLSTFIAPPTIPNNPIKSMNIGKVSNQRSSRYPSKKPEMIIEVSIEPALISKSPGFAGWAINFVRKTGRIIAPGDFCRKKPEGVKRKNIANGIDFLYRAD